MFLYNLIDKLQIIDVQAEKNLEVILIDENNRIGSNIKLSWRNGKLVIQALNWHKETKE